MVRLRPGTMNTPATSESRPVKTKPHLQSSSMIKNWTPVPQLNGKSWNKSENTHQARKRATYAYLKSFTLSKTWTIYVPWIKERTSGTSVLNIETNISWIVICSVKGALGVRHWAPTVPRLDIDQWARDHTARRHDTQHTAESSRGSTQTANQWADEPSGETAVLTGELLVSN